MRDRLRWIASHKLAVTLRLMLSLACAGLCCASFWMVRVEHSQVAWIGAISWGVAAVIHVTLIELDYRTFVINKEIERTKNEILEDLLR